MGQAYFQSWSPSRLEKYELCPARAKWEILDKKCPYCFKGTMKGKFGEAQTCDTCKKVEEVAAPLVRGNRIGDEIDAFIMGGKKMPIEVKNEEVIAYLKKVKASMAKGRAMIQKWLKLDHTWKALPDSDWSAWFNGRLDVLVREYGWKTVTVIDWKTGGVDKNGVVKPDSGNKYKDQLDSYQVGVLSYFPDVQEVKAVLVFTDTAKGEEPCVASDAMVRSQLAAKQRGWVKRLQPYFADRDFAPRVNYKCHYCPFSHARGGPCPF